MRHPSKIRCLFLGLLVALVTGCTSQSETAGDVVMTWQRAFLAYPGGDRARRLTDDVMSRLRGDGRKYPVALYLHGCTGIGDRELKFGQQLADAGFVFVAPDSMARSFRPLQCDPKQQTGGQNLFVFDFRMAELSYALGQLLELTWADPENLFLLGGSEGAVAAALYRGGEFRARVLFQWTCHGGPLVRGIAAPPNEPILAIVNQGDPWYDKNHTIGQSGHCGAFFGNREKSESVVLKRPGTHEVLARVDIRNKIQRFMAGMIGSAPKQ
jgi:dienelactone hydrolase